MKRTLILLIFLAGSTSLLYGKTVSVEKVAGPDLSESERFGIEELIESQVSQQEDHELVDQNADIVLAPSALKIGSSSFLKLDIKSKEDKTRSVKMKTKNFEDIDRVVDRLVTSALENKEVNQTADLENITRSETNRYSQRFEVNRQWEFGFGPTKLASSGTSKSGQYFKLGYNWQMDPRYVMHLTWDVSDIDKSDADFSMLGLGVNYFLDGSKASTYIGADFGYAGAENHLGQRSNG